MRILFCLLSTVPASFAALPLLFVDTGSAGNPEFVARARSFTARFTNAGVTYEARPGTIRLRFRGANPHPSMSGEQPNQARFSFFNAADSSRWRAGLSSYGSVRYMDLYPGIDMTASAESGRLLKSEFIVAPGADPARICMVYEGADKVALGSRGELLVRHGKGTLQEAPPYVYQQVGGEKVPVKARYVLRDQGCVGFELGEYDRTAVLHIDPVVTYATYAGGTADDVATALAMDSSGNMYVAGYTNSSNFPTASPFSTYKGSNDAFVYKFNAAGTALLYATFLGGASDDRAYGLGIDPSGNAYLAGTTLSADFPLVAPLQSLRKGARDAFIAKIGSSGTFLAYSTFYGGARNETAWAIAVDSFGQAYIGGETDSIDFPTKFPYQANSAGRRDAFLMKINLSHALSWATYFGGSGDDSARGVAISPSLTPFMTGSTDSPNLPLALASQSTRGGGMDAFAVRFNGDANGLIYSTYLGGSGGSFDRPEIGYALVADSFNNAYIAGTTPSANFPRVAAVQNTFGGGRLDAFVTKLDSGGARLYSTFLGGRGDDYAIAVAVDTSRKAYVGGYTTSSNFPTVSPLQAAIGGGIDGFLTVHSEPGTTRTYSSFIGGSSTDVVQGVAVVNGAVGLAGQTNSFNFPTFVPFQTQPGGRMDSFATKISGF